MNSGEKIDLRNKKGCYLGNIMVKNSNQVNLTLEQIMPVMYFLKYKRKDIAELLQVSESTISRWKSNNKRIGKERSVRLVDIDKGTSTFGSEDNFKEWLNRSNVVLGNEI